jgi:flagellar basal-body rod protein FlgC
MAIDGAGRGIPAQTPTVRPLFRPLGIAASGLSAQRARIEAIAQNIANAETTRTADGGAYRRKVVELAARPFEAVIGAAEGSAVGSGGLRRLGIAGLTGGASAAVFAGQASQGTGGGVEVTGMAEDFAEGPLVYDPGHPDADEAGYVRYPNVRLTDELVQLMEARRVYEANATVFQAVKSILRKSLEI